MKISLKLDLFIQPGPIKTKESMAKNKRAVTKNDKAVKVRVDETEANLLTHLSDKTKKTMFG